MKLGGAYVEVRAKRDKLQGDLNKAKGMVKNSVSRIQKAINTITFGHVGLSTVAITGGLSVIGRSVLNTGRQFESSMKTVQAWSGATGTELQALTDIAREMGANTEWSAQQSADALKFLAAAGFTSEQSIKALPNALNLATAGQTDLATATDITTDVLTAFGMSVDDLTRVNDAFINTTSKSNTTIIQMGEAMKYAAPTAKLFGLSIEQTSAMIGTLASSMIKGEMAGSGLNMVLLKSSKAAKALGMDAMTPLIDVLRKMKYEQWGAIEIGKVFGARQVKTATILMDNIEKYEELLKVMEKNRGATSRLSDVIRDSLDNDIKTLSSTIQEEALKAFDTYKNDIREIIQYTTNWIRENSDLIQQDVSGYIYGVANALKSIKGFYDSLPPEVVGAAGAGIVGRILFGATPAGKMATMILMVNQAMANMNEQFSLYDFSVQRLVKDWQELSEAAQRIMEVIYGERNWDTGDFTGTHDMPGEAAMTLDQTDNFVPYLPINEITPPTASIISHTGASSVSGGDMAKTAEDTLKFYIEQSNAEIEIEKEKYANLIDMRSQAIMDEKELKEQALIDWIEMNNAEIEAEKKKLEELEKSTTSFTDQMKDAFSGWATSYASTLNDMLWGSETTFGEIAKSFAKMMTQMMIQSGMSNLMSGVTNFNWSSLFTTNASGGAYAGPGISAYSNTIVSTPTVFPFANGIGLMGESGSEAILPLTRTNSGNLGVEAKTTTPNFSVNVENRTSNNIETSDVRIMQQSPGSYVASLILKNKMNSRSFRNNMGLRR